MIEQIEQCQKCGLCLNQRPILETKKECQVFWVGLSAKMIKSSDEIPLSPHTNTGMVIQKIEETLGAVSTYKTNLVKCVPLNEQHKLRYPNKKELDTCFFNLQKEIQELSPQIVFLLGEKVCSTVGKHFNIKFDKWDEYNYSYKQCDGIYYVPIHHPSYIYTYKRKTMEQYINSIGNIINFLLQEEMIAYKSSNEKSYVTI